MSEAYTTSRAVAAAAAQAHAIVPINAASTRKRKGVDGGKVVPIGSRSPSVRKDDELLSHAGALDSDEMCSEQEKALSEFLRLHPMLSLCAAHSLSFSHTLLRPCPAPLPRVSHVSVDQGANKDSQERKWHVKAKQ